jgi:hypothetical protein
MRSLLVLVPVAFLGLVAVPLAQAPAPAKPAAPRAAAPAAPRSSFRPVATVKDIMDDIMIPSSENVFNSVSSTAGPTGDVEKVPTTDADWADVRKSARLIVEAGNLLMMEGRHVAPASAKSEHPGVELEPAQMDALVAKNRAKWMQAAQGIVAAGMTALKAIDAKNVMALSDAGGDLDEACENCHVQFWYPNEKK